VSDELADRDGFGTGQGEDPPGRLRHRAGPHDAVDEVVDVHRAVHAAASGGQHELSRFEKAYRLDRPRTRAGSVDVAGAHDRARHLSVGVRREHHLLAGDLGVDVVHSVRAHGSGLVHLALEVEAEHDDRGEVDEALRATRHGRIEPQSRGQDVALPVATSGAVHADDRGGVHDQVTAAGVLLPFPRCRHVALHDRRVVAGAQVDARHLAAERPEPVHQRTADEPVRTGDEDLLRRRGVGHRPQPIPRPRAGS
jgi:hypothetical protein